MRTTITAAALAGTLALAGTACGGPGDAASCEDVADEAIVLVQDVLDEVGGMSMEDMQSAEEPEFVQELEAEGEELEQRAEELDCSDQQMADLVAERAEDLEAEGPVAELLRDAVRSGELFS